MQAKIVEITRDENGNLKEIYRPDAGTELRYPVNSGDGTIRFDDGYPTQRVSGTVLECSFMFEHRDRLDFYIK
jgi:hypothetical protein